MSAATVEYVRGMQIIKIFGVTVQYYKTLINSIKEYKQYVYQYSLSCKNPYVGFQVLFNVFYAFAVPAAVVFISYGEPAMLWLLAARTLTRKPMQSRSQSLSPRIGTFL